MPRKAIESRRKQVGARIRALRQSHGLSQAKLGTILGVKQAHVSNLERGARGVTIQQIAQLSKKLGVPIEAIVEGGKTATPPVSSLRSGRLYRYLQRVEELPAADQKAVLQILDSLLRSRRAAQDGPTHTATAPRAARRSR